MKLTVAPVTRRVAWAGCGGFVIALYFVKTGFGCWVLTLLAPSLLPGPDRAVLPRVERFYYTEFNIGRGIQRVVVGACSEPYRIRWELLQASSWKIETKASP